MLPGHKKDVLLPRPIKHAERLVIEPFGDVKTLHSIDLDDSAVLRDFMDEVE